VFDLNVLQNFLQTKTKYGACGPIDALWSVYDDENAHDASIAQRGVKFHGLPMIHDDD
jgi:hypothetical protein